MYKRCLRPWTDRRKRALTRGRVKRRTCGTLMLLMVVLKMPPFRALLPFRPAAPGAVARLLGERFCGSCRCAVC